MFHYVSALFYGSPVPQAPSLPSSTSVIEEEELVIIKSRLRPALGRNQPKKYSKRLSLPKQVLLHEILRTKASLKNVITQDYKQPVTYLPEHPVLIQILETVKRIE
jgi:hypothetical protein